MALPTTFAARVRTGVVPLSPRRAPSGAISAGLDVLGRAGMAADQRAREAERYETETEHKLALEEQRRERSRRAVAFGAQLAEARIAYTERAAEERANTEPGAPGWGARSRELVSEIFSPLAASFADDEDLALTLAPQLQRVTADIVADETAWEASRRAEWEGEQFAQVLQAEKDALLTAPDPDRMEAALTRAYDLLALTDYDGTAKAKLAQAARREIVTGTLDGLALAGRYDDVEALLASGKFDGMLGDHKDNYLRTVAAGRQAKAREAEIAASAHRDAAREALKLIEVRIDNGDPVAPGDIAAAIAAGRGAGMPASELAGYAYLGEQSVNAQQLRTMNDAVLQDEIALLRREESAGRIDPAGKRRLEQAEKALSARDGAKAESLQTLWKSGPEGRAQALQQVAAMPPDRAWAAAEKAGNARMAVFATLDPPGQAQAIRGYEARGARPDDFLPKAAGKADKDRARRIFREYIGEAQTMNLGGAFDDTFEAALDLLAGGNVGWNEQAFKRAVGALYGARRDASGVLRGGLGEVRGRMVELPSTMTASEFDSGLAKVDFSRARYADGSLAVKADVLRAFTPVLLGESGGRARYMFVDARFSPLLDENGQPYRHEFRLRGAD